MTPSAAKQRGYLRRVLARLRRRRAAPMAGAVPHEPPVAAAPTPVWHTPSRFEQRSKAAHHFISALRDGLLLVIALGAAGLAAYFGYDEWSDDRPLIGKIDAPQELEAAGYGPVVLARMLNDQLRELSLSSLVPVSTHSPAPVRGEAEPAPIAGAPRTPGVRPLAAPIYRSDPVRATAYKDSDARAPEFEVVGVGFSLHDIIRMLKAQFDALPLEIGGEVIRNGGDYGYVLRLNGERVETIRSDSSGALATVEAGKAGQRDAARDDREASAITAYDLGPRLEHIMNGAALAVLKHTQPISWAIHGYAKGGRSGVLPALDRFLVCDRPAGNAADAAMVRPATPIATLDVSRAWLLKGYIARDGDDDEGARHAFQCARDTALGYRPDDEAGRIRRSVVLAKAYESLSAYDEAEAVYKVEAGAQPNNAAILMGWASLLSSLGKFVFAAEKYQEAALADPGQIGALVALARVQGRLGRVHEAAATFERASEIAPLEAADQVDWGNALAGLSRYEQAAARYAEAARLDPSNADAPLNLGTMYWNLGLYERGNQAFDQAIAAFETVVRREPRNADKRIGLALAYAARGRFAEADTEFGRALAIDPKNPAPLFHWANTLLNRRMPGEAIIKLTALVALDPGPWNELSLGDALSALGDRKAATAHYEAAVTGFRAQTEATPGEAGAFGGLGSALGRLERHTEADAAYRRAVALDPENPRALTDLALGLASLGRRADADRMFERAMRADGQNPAPVYFWARELMARNELARAAELFERLAGVLDPGNPWNHFDLGDALSGLGPSRKAEARAAYVAAAERFEAALPFTPIPAAFYSNSAFARQKAGDNQAAAAAYAKLVTLGVANPWELVAYGDVLGALGQTEESERRYQEGLAAYEAQIVAQPDNPAPLRGLAGALSKLGRHAEAAAANDRAAALAPEDPWDRLARVDALIAAGMEDLATQELNAAGPIVDAAATRRPADMFNLRAEQAKLLGRLGRHTEAARAWEALSARAPDDPWAIANWADELWQSGAIDAAKPVFERSLLAFAGASTKSPTDVALLQGWARALSRLGRLDEADALYLQAGDLAPDDQWAQLDAGRALANKRRFDEAGIRFERAATLDANNGDAWFFWGLSLSDLGRHADALAKFERATAINPSDAAAYDAWGRALQALGRDADADAKFRRARELGAPVAG